MEHRKNLVMRPVGKGGGRVVLKKEDCIIEMNRLVTVVAGDNILWGSGETGSDGTF